MQIIYSDELVFYNKYVCLQFLLEFQISLIIFFRYYYRGFLFKKKWEYANFNLNSDGILTRLKGEKVEIFYCLFVFFL